MLKWEGTWVNLIHVDVWQKPTQYCKEIILQLKINKVKKNYESTINNWASLVAQMVQNLPAMREPWVRSLGREDPMEEGVTTHSSTLAWRIPWTVQFMGSQRVRHD